MMTRNDYAQLLKNSEVFKLLDEKIQQFIFEADGEMKETYIKIFTTAEEIEQQNKVKFIKEAQDLYGKFVHDFQEKEKKIRIVIEKANQIEDEMESQLLLDEANTEN